MSVETEKDDPDYGTPRSGVDKDELHREMLARHKDAFDAVATQYKQAMDDMEFAFMPDKQWDAWMRETRSGRPMYTVNRLRQAIKQITNDQRQNRPQVKVRAVEDGDMDLAEVRQGMIRNIDSSSDADRARDTAFQFAVGGGFGVWRVNTQYADDETFDQVIVKEEVADPYSVAFDPAAKQKDRRDAMFAFVNTDMSRAEFKRKWPKADLKSVSTDKAGQSWFRDSDVTIAEYWYKEITEETRVLLSNGEILPLDEFKLMKDALTLEGVTEVNRRAVDKVQVKQCLVSGSEILDGPNDWPGRYIPLIPVWGEILRINGTDQFCGAVRFARDAQAMYNYERSTFIEVLADQPYSPLMADARSIEGHEHQYEHMRTKKPPVLLYNGDASLPNGGKPSREPPPAFPASLANAAQISADDIKAATGIYDASLGARSNETSGKAILARQREGDVANFDFIDNLSYAMKYDFEVTNDLIPHIYDTERQQRIIGNDGSEKVVKINEQTWDDDGNVIVRNNMAQGRFDLSVTIGPSFNTQRMETADAMQNMMNDPSPFGAVAKYVFVKSLDLPGMEEAREIMRKMLVNQGLLEPKEGEQPPAPPQPDPRMIAEGKLKDAQAMKYAAETDQIRQETQMGAEWHMQSQAIPPMPNMGMPPPDFGQMPMQQPPNEAALFMPEMGQPAPDGFQG